METINFEGTEYKVAELSEDSKRLIGSIQFAESKASQLLTELAVVHAGRDQLLETLKVVIKK